MAKLFLLFMFPILTFAKTYEVQLSQKKILQPGDKIKLQNTNYEVLYKGIVEPVACANPGQNCGATYQPPRPEFETNCSKDCDYVYVEGLHNVLPEVNLSIENEETCIKDTTNYCIKKFGQSFTTGHECLQLKTALAKFYCLGRFPKDAPKKAKNICDEIPTELRTNCLAEYASRFDDASFCNKISKDEVAVKNRCYYFLAKDKKDLNLCKRITAKSDYYIRCIKMKKDY